MKSRQRIVYYRVYRSHGLDNIAIADPEVIEDDEGMGM